MSFELSSENSYNLFVPLTPVLTEETLVEMMDMLHEGLLEMPFVICSGNQLERIEREAIERLRELEELLIGEAGALFFSEFSDLLRQELEWHGFKVFPILHEAIDEVESLQLDRELGLDEEE